MVKRTDWIPAFFMLEDLQEGVFVACGALARIAFDSKQFLDKCMQAEDVSTVRAHQFSLLSSQNLANLVIVQRKNSKSAEECATRRGQFFDGVDQTQEAMSVASVSLEPRDIMERGLSQLKRHRDRHVCKHANRHSR
jgi:hypothetical protein